MSKLRVQPFRIDKSLPYYERVLLAVEGPCFASTRANVESMLDWTKPRLYGIASNYDPMVAACPLRVYMHDLEKTGVQASAGFIVKMWVEEIDGLGHLYCDIANVPWHVAAMIDSHELLTRSLSWYDADLGAAATGQPRELFLTYGKYDLYPDHLALLSQELPGNPGIGAMPERKVWPPEETEAAEADHIEPINFMFAACHSQGPHLVPSISAQEASMWPKRLMSPDGDGGGGGGPDNGAAAQAANAQAQQQAADAAKARAAATTAGAVNGGPVTLTAEQWSQVQAGLALLPAIQAENQRLQAQIAQAPQVDAALGGALAFVQGQQVNAQMQELYDNGLAVANDALVRAALTRDLGAKAIVNASNSQVPIGAGESTFELLKQIIANQPSPPTTGGFALGAKASASGAPSAAQASATLSAAEAEVAALAGMTPAEFIAERNAQAGIAPAASGGER